jgi:hypothetical protein
MYNAVNINEDLTVPTVQMNPATVFPGADGLLGTSDDIRPYNNFLQQQTALNTKGTPFWLTPDAKFAATPVATYYGNGDSLLISAKLTNIGDATLTAPFHISAYKDAVTVANKMATDSSMIALDVDDTVTVSVTIHNFSTFAPLTDILIRINDKGNAAQLQPECDTNNNTASFPFSNLLMAQNDYATTIANVPVKVGVLANDSIPAGCTSPTVSLLTPSTPHGAATLTNDTVEYTPVAGFFGFDTLTYAISCNGDTSTAHVTVLVLHPLSLKYTACPGAVVTMGFTQTEIDYFWYTTETGDISVKTNESDTLARTKDNSVLQIWWVEPRYNGITFPRYEVRLEKEDESHCGTLAPTYCVNGQLLFREDFGGNGLSDPRVSSTPLPTGTTVYTFESSDEVDEGNYALVKYIDNTSEWQQRFSDHTHPGNIDQGYMFLVNPNATFGQLYETQINDLCDRTSQLYFSAWVANVLPESNKTGMNPMLRFEISDINDNVIGTYISSIVPRDTNGKVQWRNYGLGFDAKGYHSLTLKIYNHTPSGNGNDFAIDDIEIRLCVPPVTIVNTLTDTVCLGSSHTFTASYTDDGTYNDANNKLVYRWQYSAVNDPSATWTTLKEDSTASATLNTSYTINNADAGKQGYYRLVVGNRAMIDHVNCRTVSAVITLTVLPAPNMPPSPMEVCLETYSYLPANAANAGIWVSRDTLVAKIIDNNKVLGIAVGSARVVFTSTKGCSDSINVTVKDFPVADETKGRKALCVDSSIELSNSTNLGSVWTAVWNANNTNITLENPAPNKVTVKGIKEGQSYVTYTVSDGNCQIKKTFSVKVVPNVPPTIIIGIERK